MKVSKTCGTSSGCWSTAPLLTPDGNSQDENSFQEYNRIDCYFTILADGTALAIRSLEGLTRIRVDIDGPNKGKTQIGNDIFDFSIFYYDFGGQKAFQLTPSARPQSWTGNFKGGAGYETAWIVQNSNMDYLKCEDKLNWQNQTTCK